MLWILKVVPTLLVHHLTENLNWWLGSILLNLWHVQVINEYDSLLVEFWSKDTSSSLFELTIDNVLHLVTLGLSGESNLNDVGVDVLWKLIKDNILDVLGFTCSSSSTE